MVVEKKDPGQDFTVWGDLRFQAQKFKNHHNKTAQVIAFADVSFGGCWYENIQLFSLEIHEIPEVEWPVEASFSTIIPYMIPAKNFRAFLVEQLNKFLETIPSDDQHSPWSPVWMGCKAYIRDIENFSEVKVLARQVHRSVDALMRHMDNSGDESAKELAISKLTAMLRTLEAPLATKQAFLVKGAMLGRKLG